MKEFYKIIGELPSGNKETGTLIKINDVWYSSLPLKDKSLYVRVDQYISITISKD